MNNSKNKVILKKYMQKSLKKLHFQEKTNSPRSNTARKIQIKVRFFATYIWFPKNQLIEERHLLITQTSIIPHFLQFEF